MANEPYAEYLGEGYCDRVRLLLTADDKICTDGMINSDVVIGGMKRILAPHLEAKQHHHHYRQNSSARRS